MKDSKILLGHGSGGKLTHDFIKDTLVQKFGNPILRELKDSGVFGIGGHRLAFTTDSYVVSPLFFPGGDIGRLAVCGTANDLAVCGAKPIFMSCALIIEEGLEKSVLDKILNSVRRTAVEAGVKIVTGDTKVVEKGACDKLFINTSGIGAIPKNLDLSINNIDIGDDVIINGFIGDHGISILSKREEIDFKVALKSDCACLNGMIFKVLKLCRNVEPHGLTLRLRSGQAAATAFSAGVKFMRDPTRGGVATTLNEIVEKRRFGIVIDEKGLPVRKAVRSACELLGLDPLYIGNEGKVIIISSPKGTAKILAALRSHNLGRQSRVIAKVVREHKGKVCMRTESGGLRLVDMLAGEQLPRIC